MRRLTTLTLAAAMTIFVPAAALPQGSNNCTISVTGVSFGSYDVLSGNPVQSTGSVTLQCGGAVRNIMLTLSKGQSSSFTPRTLTKGGEALSYNLYRDAALSAIWGDGTGGTQVYTDANPPKTLTLTIYANIPASQDVSAGNYTDTITATVNF